MGERGAPIGRPVAAVGCERSAAKVLAIVNAGAAGETDGNRRGEGVRQSVNSGSTLQRSVALV